MGQWGNANFFSEYFLDANACLFQTWRALFLEKRRQEDPDPSPGVGGPMAGEARAF